MKVNCTVMMNVLSLCQLLKGLFIHIIDRPGKVIHIIYPHLFFVCGKTVGILFDICKILDFNVLILFVFVLLKSYPHFILYC